MGSNHSPLQQDSSSSNIQYLKDNWQRIVRKYQKPNHKVATTQVLNTFLPYVTIWALMYWSLSVSYWLTLALALANAFFLVRVFIIQHDCGHQSFTASKRANNIIGTFCSVFSLIPYKYWAKAHNFHHGHSGQLEEDIRDIGDMPTYTVAEYQQLPWHKKLGYRIFRAPLVLLSAGSFYYIFIHNRFATIKARGFAGLWKSVVANNVYIGLTYAVGLLIFGTKFLWVQVPIVAMFSVMAFYAFFIQHQHEEAYKKWKHEWDYVVAAIKGSTYWNLPPVFQWLTGNIGIHHIHHLSSLIPNYHLQRCKDENPILNEMVTSVTFFGSMRYFAHKLWDEQQQRMITWREYRQLYCAA